MCYIATRVLAALLSIFVFPFNTLADGLPDTTVTQTSTIVVATTTITVTLKRPSSLVTTPSTITKVSTMSQLTQAPDAGQPVVKDAMNSTNFYRKTYEANALTWNSTLASFAKSHAQTCVWGHSGGPYGENIAAGYESVALAIDAWGDEEGKYNWAKQGFSEATGHFTQLVWKGTTSVGCGLTQCNNQTPDGVKGPYLVCEYSPRGNMVGEFMSNVAKKGVGSDGTLALGGAGRGMHAGGSVAALAVAYLCISAWLCL